MLFVLPLNAALFRACGARHKIRSEPGDPLIDRISVIGYFQTTIQTTESADHKKCFLLLYIEVPAYYA